MPFGLIPITFVYIDCALQKSKGTIVPSSHSVHILFLYIFVKYKTLKITIFWVFYFWNEIEKEGQKLHLNRILLVS